MLGFQPKLIVIEEDEEIRRAKANIRTGFIIAVIVIALLAVIAFVMVGLMSAVTSFPDMGTSAIPDIDILNKLTSS